MYAVIETGGKQYKVEPGEVIRVEKLDVASGSEVKWKALWASKGEKTEMTGIPKATVTAEIISQKRAPKILVFRKKTKKAYKKMRGHRQSLTEVKIKDISFN